MTERLEKQLEFEGKESQLVANKSKGLRPRTYAIIGALILAAASYVGYCEHRRYDHIKKVDALSKVYDDSKKEISETLNKSLYTLVWGNSSSKKKDSQK